jgi:CarD family transcriptional regulator
MTFRIGEKVVYPNQGVGTIENITTRPSGVQFERFYLLRLSFNSTTVMVPFSHVGDVGLRPVTRNGEIGRVLLFLSSNGCWCCSDWKNRFKKNAEKMRGGSLLEIAEVLKTLLILQRAKPLSFREKRMLDRARQMLIAELSISRGTRPEDATGLLQRALAKASLTLPQPL